MGVDSSKPKKQRLFFHRMPLHKRQKSLAANLSKHLRKALGKRSVSLRKGDKVKVVRGKHRKFEAKVSEIDYSKMRVFLEKLTRKKSDGTEIPVPVHASNLTVLDIDRSDARRIGGEPKPSGGKAGKENVGEKERPAGGKSEEKKEKQEKHLRGRGKEGKAKTAKAVEKVK